MTEEDAIKTSRAMCRDASRTDSELLDEFMLIHWATLKETKS